MTKKVYLLLALFLLIAAQSQAQGLTCETSEPFCTGSIYTFPAGTSGTAQPGAAYGCLATQPAPAWYHMLIDDPGNITIYMYSTPLVDIDFICWGPFSNPYDPCVTGLTSNTIVDCSYSPNPTEYCDIPNGQTGQYYILLITNYSQQPCNITFSQTAGSGSTDCTILPPPVGNNGPLCVGENLQLTAEFVVNASYWWSGPNGFLSTQQNPAVNNVSLVNAGDYTCTITVNGQSSDPAVTTVIIYDLPTANLISDDTTVCLGTSAAIRFQLVGWGPFEIDYNNGLGNFTATGLYGPVGTIYVTPAGPTTYNFTKVRDSHCERNLLFTSVTVGTYPQTSATLSGTGAICAGEPATLTLNLSGTPPWNVGYTANGGNVLNVLTSTTPYSFEVFPASPTLYELASVTDLYCSGQTSGSAQINVNPSPTANAGNDQTLPYGANTVLQGQGSNGSGSYSYSWQPADKLVNALVQQPTTINLTESTLFTLTVTDNSGGCQGTDQVLVNITGGPLGCSPFADPQVICYGETTQLNAMATGGSGNYTYNWSSVPGNFSSTLYNPTVSPLGNVTYYVSVSDGYNVSNGSVAVTVNPRPVGDAGSDKIIPHGTSTQLFGYATGGSGNYGYQWTPADKLVDPNVQSPFTNNLYSTTLFSLQVTDLTTGCEASATSEMTVTVSGDALAVNPVAQPEVICEGDTITLFALAGGGSGSYNYTWTSDPPGFSSALPSPWIIPTQTTIYQVAVNDGFNDVTGYCTVTVLDAPEVTLGPESITACVYDTITLDAGNPGSDYLWSNGSTTQTIDVATTGLGFDVQNYSVLVTSPSTCQSSASITIVFDFSVCSGIDDPDHTPLVKLYPNPGDGKMTITLNDHNQSVDLTVSDITGRTVYGPARISGNASRVDIGKLPAGLYFLHFRNEEGIADIYKYVFKY